MSKTRDAVIVSIDVAALAAVAAAGFVLWLWLGLLLTGPVCSHWVGSCLRTQSDDGL